MPGPRTTMVAAKPDVAGLVDALNLLLCGDYLRKVPTEEADGKGLLACHDPCECKTVMQARDALLSLSAQLASMEQAITDPENQPSQYGTVTLAMYEASDKRAHDWAKQLAEKEAECEGLRRDAERLDWLSMPGRTVDTHPDDLLKSWHEPRKAVSHYIAGKLTVNCGDTLRAAIDAAIAAREKP